jgi:hypothetical protein
MMLLTLHNLAKTYKLLPSEALARANTFDLYVLDVYARYLKYQDNKTQGKPNDKNYSLEELKAMRDRAKNFKTPAIKGA